jgi:hypothetical protein
MVTLDRVLWRNQVEYIELYWFYEVIALQGNLNRFEILIKRDVVINRKGMILL